MFNMENKSRNWSVYFKVTNLEATGWEKTVKNRYSPCF